MSEVLCICGCGKPVSRALQNFPRRGYKKGDYFLTTTSPTSCAFCRTHHMLVEKGRIDLEYPVMPRFVIRSGKRRYEGSYPVSATFWPDRT